MMLTEQLLHFIQQRVPTFTNLELFGPGTAYHYTKHFLEIQQTGGFLGAAVDPNLDSTQISLNSPAALQSPGVVFAYQQYKDAREEGWGCDIVKIEFNKAILANHSAENELDSQMNSILAESNEQTETEPPLKTVLILNTEITGFSLVKNNPTEQ